MRKGCGCSGKFCPGYSCRQKELFSGKSCIELDLTATFKLAPGVRFAGGENDALHLISALKGSCYTFYRSETVIITLLAEGKSVNEISECIATHYDIQPTIVLEDTKAFINELLRDSVVTFRSQNHVPPVASIIIPVYNGETTLNRCLNAIFAQQEAPPFEVIVVDNNSTDETRNIINSYPVTICYAHRRNRSTARNTGLREARGQFVAFIDSDVIISHDWLSTMLKKINPEHVAGVGCKTIPCREDKVPEPDEFTKPFFRHVEVAGWPVLDTAACLYRRSLLELAEGFDEELLRNEDNDLAYKVFTIGSTFILTKEVSAIKLLSGSYQYLLDKSIIGAIASAQLFAKWTLHHRTRSTFLLGFLLRDTITIIKKFFTDCLTFKKRSWSWLGADILSCFLFNSTYLLLRLKFIQGPKEWPQFNHYSAKAPLQNLSRDSGRYTFSSGVRFSMKEIEPWIINITNGEMDKLEGISPYIISLILEGTSKWPELLEKLSSRYPGASTIASDLESFMNSLVLKKYASFQPLHDSNAKREPCQ